MAIDDRLFSAGDDFDVRPFEFIDPVKWQDQPVPVRRWLVEEWIPLHSVTLLTGDGGVGKSTLALQLAVCCATGRDFLGLPTMRCKATYVCCEDESDELHRRLAAITCSMDLDLADLTDLYLVSRVGQNNVLMTFQADGQGKATAIYNQVMKAKEFGTQLIILDNAADFYGGNENIRPQVRQFISTLTRIALDIDGTLLVLFHPSMTGRALGTGESGSTGWNNAVRSRLYLATPGQWEEKGKKRNDPPDDVDARVLSRQKSNYSRAGHKISLRYLEGAFVNHGEPLSQDGSSPDRRGAAKAAFLAGMQELATQGLRVNVHKGQSNYAPKMLVEVAQAAADFDESELTWAMKGLLKDKRIKSKEEGPPSRRRSSLQIVEPIIPGLIGSNSQVDL